MRTRTRLFALASVLTTGMAVGAGQLAASEPDHPDRRHPNGGRPAAAPDFRPYGVAAAVGETIGAAEFGEAIRANMVLAFFQGLEAQAAAEAAARTRAPASRGAGGGGDFLACTRSVESGGDYAAVSAGGTYRGAYQFSQQTWQSVGGTGDPAAASPEEQDHRAQILYSQQGAAPWGGRCG